MDNTAPSTQSPPAVALFGGSFNPPHMAHTLVVAWALGMGEIGEVWVFPTGGHPFGKELAPFADRMEMCRRAFAPFGARARVLDLEAEPRVHYSVETVERLAAEHPGRRWRWLMGSDTLADAARWKRYEDLTRIAPPLAVPRAGRGSTGMEAFALPDVSSTLVRGLLAARDWGALDGLVPRPVLDYVKEKSLYKGAEKSN